METLPREMVMKALTDVMAEAYEGPADPRGTWFVDNAPDAGVFGVLDGISADGASRAPGPGRATLAAHAGHLRFSLEVSRRWISGERPRADWRESWAVSSVGEEEWRALKAALRDEYAELRRVLDAMPVFDPVSFTSMVAALAHAAYHLGAMRQLALAVRTAETSPEHTGAAVAAE